MLRFFSSKIIFVFFLTQNLFGEKVPDLHEYIDSNAQYFLTVIKEEGSNYDDNPEEFKERLKNIWEPCLLYTSPSPRDMRRSRMPSSA